MKIRKYIILYIKSIKVLTWILPIVPIVFCINPRKNNFFVVQDPV